MNYLFRDAVNLYFVFNKLNVKQFDSLLSIPRKYPKEVQFALQNLVGSHDTERFLTLTKGNTAKVKLVALFQMTYIGAPMVYYGDEIGMMGGRDPDCRRTMVWDTLHWNIDLRNFYKKLIDLRKQNKVFTRGSYKTILTDSKRDLFGFLREFENEKAIVILNTSNNCQTVKLQSPDRNVKKWIDLLNDVSISQKGKSKITIHSIPPMSGAVLIPRK
jgi:glycosidase